MDGWHFRNVLTLILLNQSFTIMCSSSKMLSPLSGYQIQTQWISLVILTSANVINNGSTQSKTNAAFETNFNTD